MFNRQAIWTVLLAVIAGNTLSASVIRPPQTEFRHLYALNANGRVVIENVYGDVSITAWDRDEVLVEAITRSVDPRRLDDAHIVVEPTAGLLSIRTQYAGSDGQQPASVEYRITVPRGATLQDVKLTNGGLLLNGLAGSVKASAINGSITAMQLRGPADLSTINGGVVASFQCVSRAKSISLTSVNGPIRLTIPSAAGPALVASNRSGGIASDVGKVFRTGQGDRLVVKGGGVQIHLRNVNGGISIHSHEHPWT
jgi:DUF4097 and DUF4098 domain-containing protein YvlB